jgi:hypothetical protein
VEETAHQENAPPVSAELVKMFKILPLGVLNIHGIKPAANVLSHMKVEEMLMLSTTTLTDLLMLDFGKLIM